MIKIVCNTTMNISITNPSLLRLSRYDVDISNKELDDYEIIQYLEPLVKQNIPIYELDISGNNLTFVPVQLRNLDICVLILNNNKIQFIPEWLVCKPNLNELYVSNNKLCDFPWITSPLHRIDVSYNKFQYMPESILLVYQNTQGEPLKLILNGNSFIKFPIIIYETGLNKLYANNIFMYLDHCQSNLICYNLRDQISIIENEIDITELIQRRNTLCIL